MLLKILWVLDVFILIPLILGVTMDKPEKGTWFYIIGYIFLIAFSYKIRENHPRAALVLASIPVLIPILIVAFLALAFITTKGLR